MKHSVVEVSNCENERQCHGRQKAKHTKLELLMLESFRTLIRDFNVFVAFELLTRARESSTVFEHTTTAMYATSDNSSFM